MSINDIKKSKRKSANDLLDDQNDVLVDQNDLMIDQNIILVDQNVVLVDQKPSGGGKSGESS